MMTTMRSFKSVVGGNPETDPDRMSSNENAKPLASGAGRSNGSDARKGGGPVVGEKSSDKGKGVGAPKAWSASEAEANLSKTLNLNPLAAEFVPLRQIHTTTNAGPPVHPPSTTRPHNARGKRHHGNGSGLAMNGKGSANGRGHRGGNGSFRGKGGRGGRGGHHRKNNGERGGHPGGQPNGNGSAANASNVQRANEDSIKRTVYICDVDQQVTEAQLASIFIDSGPIIDCRVCGDPNSAMRFAFIEFEDEESAKNALVKNGTVLGLYPLRVLPSRTAIVPVNLQYLPQSYEEREQCGRTVYAANIDKKVDRNDVRAFFETLCGRVSKLRLLGDYQHATRIAFIEFFKAESAIAALNCSGALLGSLPIRVSPSKTPVRPDPRDSAASAVSAKADPPSPEKADTNQEAQDEQEGSPPGGFSSRGVPARVPPEEGSPPEGGSYE